MSEEHTEAVEESPEGAAPRGDEEAAQAPEAVNVWGVLQYCFMLLHSQAWQAMGLVPDPTTREIRKDLSQARVAIDTASFIVTQLEQTLDGKPLRDLRAMLSDLQINYVNQSRGPAAD